MDFSEFKKVIRETGPEIAAATGYSRVGLYEGFKSQSSKFKVVIFNFVQSKINEENRRHEKRLAELLKLQEEFRPYSSKAADIAYLEEHRKAVGN